VKDEGVKEAIGEAAGVQPQVEPEGIKGQSKALESELTSVLHQKIENGGMQMQVQVAIDMVQRQTGGAELFKLGVNFRAQLLAEALLEKIAKRRAGGIIAEFHVPINQAGYLFRRRSGMPAQKSEVEANAKTWILTSQGDGLGASRLVHHETGGGQNALAVRANDSCVNTGGAAEIVGIDDEAARV
jgi:hypothetical protein